MLPLPLLNTLRRYDFDKLHDGLKQMSMRIDNHCYGWDALGLLLFFGDLEAVRRSFAKLIDAQQRILTRVRQGAATSEGCVPLRAACTTACARRQSARIN